MTTTLSGIQSFALTIGTLANTAGLGAKIDSSPVQMVIVGGVGQSTSPDVARSAVDPDHSKIVLSDIDVTEANPIYNPDLFVNGQPPSWFGKEQQYYQLWSVQYWNPLWEQSVFKEIDASIADGYDGLYLDVLYGDLEWSAGNAYGNPVYADATPAMAKLISDIVAYVQSKHLSTPFYLLGVDPEGVANESPSSLKGLSGIALDSLYYNVNIPGVYEGPGGIGPDLYASRIQSYTSLGLPVFGTDYPPAGDSAADFQAFAYYTALGWVPSINPESQTAGILTTGPFMYMAVAGNSTVRGADGYTDFLSGGLVADATLIGGDSANYFIGGPGHNAITGGAGTDIIYAHPASAALKGVLDLHFISGATNAASTPQIEILVNGQVAAAPTTVTSNYNVAGSSPQDITINLAKYGTITSIAIEGLGLSYTDATHFSNVFLTSATYQGQTISLANAQYNSGSSFVSDSAEGLLNQNGVITLTPADLPAAPFDSDTSDIIDGGAGVNTVVYRAASADYTLTRHTDGSILVTALVTAEGPDTLTNIQHVQFTDGTEVFESAAQLSSQIDNLQSLAASNALLSLTLTDSGVPTVTVTAAQFAADTAVLNDISSPHAVTVEMTGTAAAHDFAGENWTGASALQFADQTVIVAAAPGPANAVTTGNITELYSAVLAREPDVGGLAFYQNFLKSNPSTPLQTFAEFFLNSAEYTSAHSYAESVAGDEEFITDSYTNLLHRTPSASEVSFYKTNVLAPAVANLTPGTAAYASAQLQAHALMLVYFSASAEFLGDVQITASNPASAQHWLLLT